MGMMRWRRVLRTAAAYPRRNSSVQGAAIASNHAIPPRRRAHAFPTRQFSIRPTPITCHLPTSDVPTTHPTLVEDPDPTLAEDPDPTLAKSNDPSQISNPQNSNPVLPTGKRSTYWRIHQEVLTNHQSLPSVWPRLQLEMQRNKIPRKHLQDAISFFYSRCAEYAATLDPAFVSDVLAVFETSLFGAGNEDSSANETRNAVGEAVISSAVKLYVVTGELEAAWRVVDRAVEEATARNVRVHYRVFKQVLEAECREHGFQSAMQRWEQVRALKVEATETMVDTLVDLLIACQREQHKEQEQERHTGPNESIAGASSGDDGSESKRRKHSFAMYKFALVQDLRRVSKEITLEQAKRLADGFRGANHRAALVQSDRAMWPKCPACTRSLTKEHVTENEWQELQTAVEAMRARKHRIRVEEALRSFREWILNKHANAKPGQLHFILDGPNLAYLNQNFNYGRFRFDHIEATVQILQRAGHLVSVTIPASYLEETSRLTVSTRNLRQLRRADKNKVLHRFRTRKEAELIAKWQDEDLIFGCHMSGFSDDIYWLYASMLLRDQARIVTNDMGRDHVFDLLHPGSRLSPNKTTTSNVNNIESASKVSLDVLERWRDEVLVGVKMFHALSTRVDGKNEDTFIKPTAASPLLKSVRLQYPNRFSRVPQLDASQHLHVPIESAGWLCLSPLVKIAVDEQ